MEMWVKGWLRYHTYPGWKRECRGRPQKDNVILGGLELELEALGLEFRKKSVNKHPYAHWLAEIPFERQ